MFTCAVLSIDQSVAGLSARSTVKNNLVFTNIVETHNENVSEVLRSFFKHKLCISEEQMTLINIVSTHRMGQKRDNYVRPIVANIIKEGHGVIMSHVKNLKSRGSLYSVFPQLPKELAERKKHLYPVYRAAKDNGRKVRWSGASLYVDGEHQITRKDAVDDATMDTADRALEIEVMRAPPQQHGGSTFQGSRAAVTSVSDVLPAMHVVFFDSKVARASHTFYAYRINTPNGMIEHFEDDGEYGGGSRLLNHLRTEHIHGQLLCVTRWNGLKQLGPVRFDYFSESAEMALYM